MAEIGLVLAVVISVIRMSVRYSRQSWGHTLVHWGALTGVFLGFVSMPVEQAVGLAACAALVAHFLKWAFSPAQGGDAAPTTPPTRGGTTRTGGNTRTNTGRTNTGRTNTGRTNTGRTNTGRTRTGGNTQTGPAAPSQGNPPNGAGTARAGKKKNNGSAEQKQTLTACLKCRRTLSGTVCSACGFNHASGQIRMLMRCDPRKLQMKR